MLYVHLLINPRAHGQRGLRQSFCVSVCLSAAVSLSGGSRFEERGFQAHFEAWDCCYPMHHLCSLQAAVAHAHAIIYWRVKSCIIIGPIAMLTVLGQPISLLYFITPNRTKFCQNGGDCVYTTILTLQATRRVMSDTNSFTGTWARKLKWRFCRND